MKDTSVPEADRDNLLRLGEPWPRCQGEASGGKPRPIRKRGFWRAYRRGELWVIVSYRGYGELKNKGGDEYGNAVFPDRNCATNNKYILWPTVNLSRLSLPEEFLK